MRPFQTQEKVAEAIRENEGLIWYCVNKWHFDSSVAAVIDRDDMFQRCCEHLLEHLGKYDTDRGAFAAYFVAICRTALRREHATAAWSGTRDMNGKADKYMIDGRGQTLMSAFVGDDGSDYGADQMWLDGTVDLFDTVDDRMWLESLPADHRKMVLMLAMGYTFGEIAAVMGVRAKYVADIGYTVGPARAVQLLLADVMRTRNPELQDAELHDTAIMVSTVAKPQTPARERTCFEEGYCWYGHELTEANVYLLKGKKRVDGTRGPERRRCKQCRSEQTAARKEAKKQTEVTVPFSEATQRRLHVLIVEWLQKLLHLPTREYKA